MTASRAEQCLLDVLERRFHRAELELGSARFRALRSGFEFSEGAGRAFELSVGGRDARQHGKCHPSSLSIGPRRLQQCALELLERALWIASLSEQQTEAWLRVPAEPVRLAKR